MRNLKTALAVMVCLGGYALLGLPAPFYACIAAIICMQDTVTHTVRFGLSRVLGTAVGGALGLGLLWLDGLIGLPGVHILLVGAGVAAAIYLGVLLNNPQSCTISATVLCAVLLIGRSDSQFIYALNRILETFFGIVVAVLINRFINPPVEATDEPLKWSWKIPRTDLLEHGSVPLSWFRRSLTQVASEKGDEPDADSGTKDKP